jgi:two-component system alkaline phosphatase synthesis response regulator PhoP
MATKIAIIEDDLAISQMYRIKFETDGYEVETAENGKQGLELCEKMKPEIILLDVMMPEMTGPEMLEKLRQTDWGAKTKVLILTNMGEHEIPDVVKKYNVEDVILKADMTPSQVAALVKKTIGS